MSKAGWWRGDGDIVKRGPNGKMEKYERDGYRSPNGLWLLFRDNASPFADRKWNLTHLPSGCRTSYFRTKANAILGAALLETVKVPWEKMTYETALRNRKRYERLFASVKAEFEHLRAAGTARVA